MNRIQFGEGACEKTRLYMDAYLSSELLVETTQELLRHLEGCPACAAELEARTRLRGRLKAAVQGQAAPPELPALVRERLRSKRRSSAWFAMAWPRYGIAAMAVALICAAFWASPGNPSLPGLTDRAAQATYVRRVSAKVGQVFRPGLADHIHCAIFRKYPQTPPSPEEMQARLGVEYQGLLPLVAPVIPEGYRVVLAHRCSYGDRHFVHLTMRKGNEVISLVIARKNDGETFHGLPPAVSASGVPVYQASTEDYRVAGFESDPYLVFVISELGGKANLQLAAALAPEVRRLLTQEAPGPLL